MNEREDQKRTQRLGSNVTVKLSEAEQEKLVAYLDGELDDAAERRVLAEIGTRPELRQEAASLKKTWDLLDFLPKSAPPPQFTERTMHKLQVTKLLLVRREQWWKRIAVAGWVFTLGLVGLLGFAAAYYWPAREWATRRETKPEATPSSTDPKRLDPPHENLPEHERLMQMVRQETNRMVAELTARLEPYERTELARKRREGGLIFMEELLSLAKKYNVPLQRPRPGGGAGGQPLGAPRDEEPPLGAGAKPKKQPAKPGDKPTATGPKAPSAGAKPTGPRPTAPTRPGGKLE